MLDPTTMDATGPVPPEGGRSACVAAIEGGVRGVFELAPNLPLAIGRSRSSGICVDDAAVSRLHATLTWDGGDLVRVDDHGSRNGTLLRGVRVEGEAIARAGDAIGVGPARFVVLVSREPDTAVRASGAMGRARTLAERAANCDLSVLVLGETGTGKEVLARTIHAQSTRAAGPFVPVNCGSIPETLAESLLFGHEKGAFTGATAQQVGVFEAARGGTVFLDEVGELPKSSQARLLRVLEAREITRVGATKPTPIDVRVISATHRDLDRAVAEGSFRSDLLYRLDVLRITVPPLRERLHELPALAAAVLHDLDPEASLDADGLRLLAGEPFPGNLRELRNVLARALAVSGERRLDRAAISAALPEQRTVAVGGALRGQVATTERDAIEQALAATGGNQTHAAKRLGISRRALLYKMERHGLTRARTSGRGSP